MGTRREECLNYRGLEGICIQGSELWMKVPGTVSGCDSAQVRLLVMNRSG